MIGTYTAPTNKHLITTLPSGSLRINKPGMDFVNGHEPQTLVQGRVESLCEYFQDKRDKELGRWRDPNEVDFKGYVVYPAPEGRDYNLRVMCEETGESKFYARTEDDGAKRNHPWESPYARAARAYYDAHPEKPQPWEDAPVGSVWKIVSGGLGRHALLWRSNNGDWDILGPKGESLKEIDDPLAALVEAGYPEFEEYKSAVAMKES